jgi:hypothetical protein
MKTLEEIKKFLADEGYEGEPTPQILRLYGWEPADPLAGVDISGPAVSPAELKDHLALLAEEAKANNVPAKIMEGIAKFGGMALKLVKP